MRHSVGTPVTFPAMQGGREVVESGTVVGPGSAPHRLYGSWTQVQLAYAVVDVHDDNLTVQCSAFWPSPVTGGLTDAQCVNAATVPVDGEWFCGGCAREAV